MPSGGRQWTRRWWQEAGPSPLGFSPPRVPVLLSLRGARGGTAFHRLIRDLEKVFQSPAHPPSAQTLARARLPRTASCWVFLLSAPALLSPQLSDRRCVCWAFGKGRAQDWEAELKTATWEAEVWSRGCARRWLVLEFGTVTPKSFSGPLTSLPGSPVPSRGTLSAAFCVAW